MAKDQITNLMEEAAAQLRLAQETDDLPTALIHRELASRCFDYAQRTADGQDVR